METGSDSARLLVFTHFFHSFFLIFFRHFFKIIFFCFGLGFIIIIICCCYLYCIYGLLVCSSSLYRSCALFRLTVFDDRLCRSSNCDGSIGTPQISDNNICINTDYLHKVFGSILLCSFGFAVGLVLVRKSSKKQKR